MSASWTDLIPSLAQMLEQRFGRPRYHLESAIALAAAFAIILMPITILGGVVSGVVLLFHGSVDIDTVKDYLFAAFTVVIIFPLLWVGTRFVMRRGWRRLNRERANFREHVAEHMSLGHVIIHVIGEDAQTQWSRIRRELDAWVEMVNEWEREQEEVEDSDG